MTYVVLDGSSGDAIVIDPVLDYDPASSTTWSESVDRVVSHLEIPQETLEHPYFDFHELTAPLEETVTKRTAFGTHWGLVYFHGDDPYQLRDLLKHQEDLDFYI